MIKPPLPHLTGEKGCIPTDKKAERKIAFFEVLMNLLVSFSWFFFAYTYLVRRTIGPFPYLPLIFMAGGFIQVILTVKSIFQWIKQRKGNTIP